MKYLGAVPALVLLCICVAGCSSKDKSPPLTTEQSAVKSRLEAQMKEAAKTAQTYHEMDNATLLGHLMEQSKARREPFNSLAYRELRTRTNVEPNALSKLVQENQNADGLLPLLLLRKLDGKAYMDIAPETRAKVLTDALAESKNFNTWGLPGVYLEDASNAMIEAGRSAFPALKLLLRETRPAPLFGSKESMLAQQYKYRLCDYALFFLRTIEGDAQFKLPTASEERDSLITKVEK